MAKFFKSLSTTSKQSNQWYRYPQNKSPPLLDYIFIPSHHDNKIKILNIKNFLVRDTMIIYKIFINKTKRRKSYVM